MKLIAGPCLHESIDQSLEIANTCKELCDEYYFKASYNKANRSHISSERGKGLVDTMHDFRAMKKEIPDLKILTDVHSVQDITMIESFGGVVDVYQIPAFLCRQTDLIVAACNKKRVVNIKKGQFLAPWDVAGILSKTLGEVWITERGTSFGYNNLVVDYTGIKYMLDTYEVPIVFDATHSVQKPGGLGKTSGGNSQYAGALAKAAAAIGVKNFFFEVHKDPKNAPSDGPNMISLNEFSDIFLEVEKLT